MSNNSHGLIWSINGQTQPTTKDLWGKTRANVNATELEYLAARQDLEAGALPPVHG